MFYLTTHSTHFILRMYGIRHMVKDYSAIEKVCCRHYIGYSFRLPLRGIVYADPSERIDIPRLLL